MSPIEAQVECTGNCGFLEGAAAGVAFDGNGDGTLTILNGATLNLPDGAGFGFNGTDTATVLVSGPGSQLTVGDTLLLGVFGGATGNMTITDGANVTVNEVTGDDNFPEANVLIGDGGTGTLDITNGGSLLVQDLSGGPDATSEIIIGFTRDGDGTGELNVDGAESSVTVNGIDAIIDMGGQDEGSQASGSLNVTNGATVSLNGESEAFLGMGFGPGGRARVTIDGPESSISLTGGDFAFVEVGGEDTADDGIPTEDVLARGDLWVTNSGLLDIQAGPQGQAQLNIAFGRAEGLVVVDDGGTIRVGGDVFVAPDETGNGGDAQLANLVVNDTGVIEAERVILGDSNQGGYSAYLFGTGTVRVSDQLIVSGRGQVWPGAAFGAPAVGEFSIGTLTIEGDVRFENDAVLQIDALENGNGDRLVVTGTADLNGQVRSLSPDGEWSVARDYVILTADEGIDGEFDEVTSNLPYLTPTLSYTENSVRLSLSRLGGEVQEEVLEESSAQQLSVNSRVVPVVIQNQVATTIGAAFSTGSSPAVVHTPGSISTGLAAGDDESSGNIWANLTPSDYRTDAIVPGSNTTQSIEGDGLNFLVGADQLIGDRFVVGLFAGAESSDVDIVEIRGQQEVDGLLLGAYGGVALGQYFYLSGNGNYTWLENEIEEQAFGNPEPVTGEFDSERYSLGIDLNAVKVFERFDLRGVLGYNYSKEKFDSYETSIGDVASPRDARLGRARLAVSSSYLGEVLNPYVSVAYEYDVETSNETLDDDGFVLAAGFRGRAMDQRLTMEAYFSGVVDRATQEQYLLGLNVHYAW